MRAVSASIVGNQDLAIDASRIHEPARLSDAHFESLSLIEARHQNGQLHLVHQSGSSNGASIIPTTLFAYLRPDALRFESSPPFVTFRLGNPTWEVGYERITYLPPLPKDYLSVECTTSLVALAPLGVAAVIGALAVTLRKRRQRFHFILLASMAAQPAIMLMTWGVSLRYLADFYPLVAMSIVILIPYVPRLESQNTQTRRIAVTFVTLFTVWSLWVVPAMATQDARISLFGIASR